MADTEQSKEQPSRISLPVAVLWAGILIGVEPTTNKKGEARIGPPPMTSDRRAVGSRDHEPPTAKLTPAYMPI